MLTVTTSVGLGAHFLSDMTQVSSLDLAFVCITVSGRFWLCSKPLDEPKYFPKQVSGHGDLRHLERDVAGMRDDLHELLPEARQRPVLDRRRQSQRAHEIGEVVGECVKLKTDSVGLK